MDPYYETEALLYDVRHSNTIRKFLRNRKQLYLANTCLFTITANKTKGHNTPFVFMFPTFDEVFYTKFPRMSHGPLQRLFYIPATATTDEIEIPAPKRLHWGTFSNQPEFKLLKQVCQELSEYVRWHGDSFCPDAEFQFHTSGMTSSLCKYFFTQ